jgi:5'-3' exonuclease
MQAPPLLLVDFDPTIYKASSASEDELEFSPEVTVVTGDFRRAKQIVEQEIRNLYSRFNTNRAIFFLTSSTNFRKEVDPTYKGNRLKRKPAGYKKLKEWAKSQFHCVEQEGLEADDLIGIEVTLGKHDNFVLCSPDKDMEQFPVRIWNGRQEFTQSPEKAVLKRWMQALTGDQTDGYQGCPGVGPVKAEKILSKVKDGKYYEAVRDAFIQAGYTEEDAIRNIRLATILTSDLWNPATKAPILFTP